MFSLGFCDHPPGQFDHFHKEGGRRRDNHKRKYYDNTHASKHAASNTRVSEPACKIRKKQEAWNKSLRACQQDKKEAGVVEGGREGGREKEGTETGRNGKERRRRGKEERRETEGGKGGGRGLGQRRGLLPPAQRRCGRGSAPRGRSPAISQ